jgi:hypothetical protein
VSQAGKEGGLGASITGPVLRRTSAEPKDGKRTNVSITQTTSEARWSTDNGQSTVTVDDTAEQRIWDEDSQRHVPAVVVRMDPWIAERRARILADWSEIADMMDESEERSDRRFAASLMRAALLAMGKASEAEDAAKRILGDLYRLPEDPEELLEVLRTRQQQGQCSATE